MSSTQANPAGAGMRKSKNGEIAEDAVLKKEFATIHGRRSIDPSEDYCHAAHTLPGGQSALCLSGGGIRSAAFALGVLQGLAECGVLGSFHYLSTVSGGGYIGSWLTAWRKRAGLQSAVNGLDEKNQTTPPNELSNLRGGSTYLSPKAGLFSGDTWTDIVLIFRNLLLINLLITPLFAALLVLGKLTFLSNVELLMRISGSGVSYASIPLAACAWIVLAQRRPSWARRVNSAAVTGRCNSSQVWAPRIAITLFWIASMFFTFTANRYLFLDVPVVYFENLSPISDFNLHRPLNFDTVGADFRSLYAGLATAWKIVLAAALTGAVTALLAILSTYFDCFRGNPTVQGNVTREMPLAWAPIILSLLLAGTVAGVLLALWLMLAQYIHTAMYCHFKTFIAFHLCTSPLAFTLAIITAENIYLGLNTRRHKAVPPKKWNDKWGDEEREWVARSYGYLLVCVIATCVFLSVSIFSSTAVDAISNANTHKTLWKVFSGLVALFSGLATVGLGSSSLSKGNGTASSNRKIPVRLILIVATPIFSLMLLMGLSALLDEILFQQDVLGEFHDNPLKKLFIVTLALAAIPPSLSSFFNINRYSLHDLYRNRLTREFLGASNLQRKGDPWTGFDTSDDLPLRKCFSRVLYPVINVTLNALHQTRLQLLHRQAHSFVFTPLYCGSKETGYRSTRRYAEGMRLGSAMAISGAAVSPNAGYSTMKGLSLLLTIFNLRLGVWAGNPSDKKSWKNRGPKWALRPLFSEAFSRTNENAKYVYLSDGGHFDNLGLFEMLKRRCRHIVVSDASADSDFEFEDLGRIVRRAALELNVEIVFPKDFDLGKRRDKPFSGPYSAIADVVYPEKHPRTGEHFHGRLLYIKAGYHGSGEPMDVRAFAATNPKFPHDPTSNQFFDESYFESYRSLGRYIIRDLYGAGLPSSSLGVFFGHCASALNTTRAAAHRCCACGGVASSGGACLKCFPARSG